MKSQSIVETALEILDMAKEIDSLRSEVAELRKYKTMYYDLLANSTRHSGAMMDQLMGVLTTPGVSEALNNKAIQEGAPTGFGDHPGYNYKPPGYNCSPEERYLKLLDQVEPPKE